MKFSSKQVLGDFHAERNSHCVSGPLHHYKVSPQNSVLRGFISWPSSLTLLWKVLITAQSAIMCQFLHEELYWEQLSPNTE